MKPHKADRSAHSLSEQIYRDLRTYILSAPADSPLTSARGLAAQYDIGIAIIRRALNHLIDDGLIYSIYRQGYFVSPRKEEAQLQSENTILYINPRPGSTLPFLERKFEAVVDEAARYGYTLAMRPTHYESVVNEAADPSVIGLIVPWMAGSFIKALEQNPGLHIITQFRDKCVHPRIGQVDIDYTTSAASGIEHLSQQGAKTIAVVGRHELFYLGAKKGRPSQTCPWITYSVDPEVGINGEGIDRLANEILSLSPDALLFDEDVYADQILQGLKERDAGARKDMLCASLCNRTAPILDDDVTCLEIDGYDIGVANMSMIKWMREKPGMPCPTLLIPATVVSPKSN
ncbi:MAG: GntR family transcriptional regulator [Planctomycetota bacterium]